MRPDIEQIEKESIGLLLGYITGPKSQGEEEVTKKTYQTPPANPGKLMTDPLEWFKDQARLFQRDQRLKKASRERLERTGIEAPTRKKRWPT